MTDERKVRLDIIDAVVDPEETVIVDVLALLFDPGDGLKKREAEGHLVLTNRRLIFATSWHGIMVDLSREETVVPVSQSQRWMMARLVVRTCGGRTHEFVLNKSAARDIALAINKTTPG
jgi:hypothetical protein